MRCTPSPPRPTRPCSWRASRRATATACDAITSRLPLVLGIIAGITLVLLFLLTGSVVLPRQGRAAQHLVADGRVRRAGVGLPGRSSRRARLDGDGHVGCGLPVLLFCIAFGLSMDYEVFLISRIREYWLASDRTPAANDESVALGVARTGRVITAAALIMSISFAALIAAHVSLMRMFGLGLTVAVLIDATFVRMLLVPAFMRVLGRANWWAPKPLARLHDRIGFGETVGHGTPDAQTLHEPA